MSVIAEFGLGRVHREVIALGVDIRSARPHAEGEFDARGTLGISRDVPVGVRSIQLIAEVDTDSDDQTLARC